MNKNTGSIAGQKYKLIFYGDTLSIKGSYDICSYDEYTVIIRCNHDTVCIKGADLAVASMDTDEIYIRGRISDISFS